MEPSYMCIDLKSFYASVECVERGLDPFKTRLVVADPSRTERTICLAVSPAMKALGVPGRCRVFEIPQNIDYIMAVPRMALYIDYSTRIYGIYLKYFSPQDIHVYSIDEVFIDMSRYLQVYKTSALGMARRVIKDVLDSTGITATCGLGSNLYLAKIAMDITSKKNPENIGVLTEEAYRRTLWNHLPLTDFWQVGKGTVARLERLGLRTMYDIAHADETALYKTFGIDARLLIDHAWGRESTTIEDIKRFVPKSNSLTSGQVLACGYNKQDGAVIVEEMTEELVLSLVDKGFETQSVSLHLSYEGKDGYSSDASVTAEQPTSSTRELCALTAEMYDRIFESDRLVRRVTIVFNNVLPASASQYNIFRDARAQEREHGLQLAMIGIKKKYGKNSIVKCMDLQKCATMMERNAQIGGHRA